MLKNLFKIFSVVLLLGISIPSHAYLEINGYYNSDNFKNSANTTSTAMFYDASIGFAVDKKSYFLVGWNYTGHSTSKNNGTTTETYSTTQMGPRFILFFDKAKMFNMGFAYNLSTKGTFNNGTNTYTWKGTGMKADIGVNFPMGETSFIGLRLNYSTTAYNEQLEGASSYTQVSYNRTLMYPSIYFFFGF